MSLMPIVGMMARQATIIAIMTRGKKAALMPISTEYVILLMPYQEAHAKIDIPWHQVLSLNKSIELRV
jgi:hypothetical protein